MGIMYEQLNFQMMKNYFYNKNTEMKNITEMMYNSKDTLKLYAVTDDYMGGVVAAHDEYEAKNIAKKAYPKIHPTVEDIEDAFATGKPRIIYTYDYDYSGPKYYDPDND